MLRRSRVASATDASANSASSCIIGRRSCRTSYRASIAVARARVAEPRRCLPLALRMVQVPLLHQRIREPRRIRFRELAPSGDLLIAQQAVPAPETTEDVEPAREGGDEMAFFSVSDGSSHGAPVSLLRSIFRYAELQGPEKAWCGRFGSAMVRFVPLRRTRRKRKVGPWTSPSPPRNRHFGKTCAPS